MSAVGTDLVEQHHGGRESPDALLEADVLKPDLPGNQGKTMAFEVVLASRCRAKREAQVVTMAPAT